MSNSQILEVCDFPAHHLEIVRIATLNIHIYIIGAFTIRWQPIYGKSISMFLLLKTLHVGKHILWGKCVRILNDLIEYL